MTIHCRIVDGPGDAAGFQRIAELYRADSAARDPGDEPLTDRQIDAELFAPLPRRQRFVCLAETEGSAVGAAWASTDSEPDDELQLVSVDMWVQPEHRRSGVADALLRTLIPVFAAAGQNSIAGYPCHELDVDAARSLCERLGMTNRQLERCSRALVADIDDGLMARWVADAAETASGYRLEQWEGPCPEHLAEAWSIAAAGMEDAPLGDFEYNWHTRGVIEQREDDDAYQRVGFRLYRSLVIAPDGSPAGMTMIFLHTDRPQVAYQDDTAVLEAHRGNRIGRWLKAANYRQVRAAHPQLRVIETYNAQSNKPMLDINVAMGFKPHHHYDLYQCRLSEAATALGID